MMVLKVVIVLMAIASYASVANGLCCPGCPLSSQCADGTSLFLTRTAVQLVPAISSVAAAVECVVDLPFFSGACSLWLRLKLITLMWLLSALISSIYMDKNGAIDVHKMKQADNSMLKNLYFEELMLTCHGMITIEEFDENAGRAIQEKIRQELAN